MSKGGASGVAGWLGDIHCTGSAPSSRRLVDVGMDDALSVPPATTTRSMPARIDAAPICTADRPAAQWRLSARPGTSVRPSSTAT